jgi:hypothetical protein
MLDNGEVQEISGKTLNRWQRETEEEWRRRHCGEGKEGEREG